jgi:hypothetical protein
VNADTGLASQFLPRMVANDDTGELYFAWLDTRNDTGSGGDDTNLAPNDDAETFVSRARPAADGMLVGDDVQVSQGPSNAKTADNSIELGDYIGLAFDGTRLLPLWADNSNSTGDNPDGADTKFDQYTARVPAAALPAPGRLALASLPGGFRAVYTPSKTLALGGRSDFRFRVTYSAPDGIDPASLSGSNLLVTGPSGFGANAALLSVRAIPRRGQWIATYSIPAAGGRWTRDDNGVYTIELLSDQVRTGTGGATPAGDIGTFAVKTSLSATA